MDFPLSTQRLRLAPLTLADLSGFVAYRSDPEIARYQSWDAPYSEAKAFELISDQINVSLPTKGDWLQIGIHLSETDELVGDLALHQLDDLTPGFEIGFTVARKHQNLGYAREAASRLIDELSNALGVNRFVATADRRNIASIKVLSALGFTQPADKSWEEQFKGELVTVDYFELVHTQ
jgi:RimJ/RimL family protein N-acetyltransferase